MASQAKFNYIEKHKIYRRDGTIRGESTRKRDTTEIAIGAAIGAGIETIAGGTKKAPPLEPVLVV